MGPLSQPDRTRWALLEMVADGVVVVNSEGRIVYSNRRMEALLGYAPSELFSQHLNVLLAPAIAEAHDQMRDTFHANPSVREMGAAGGIEGRHRNGSYVPLDIHLQPIESVGLVVASIRHRGNTPSGRIDWITLAAREQEARALLDLVIQRLYGIALSLEATSTTTGSPSDHLERSTALIDDTIDLIRTTVFEPARRDPDLAIVQSRLLEPRTSDRTPLPPSG